MKIHGAEARVHLSWNGSIEALCESLKDALILPSLSMETHIEPPHESYYTGETLGFEIWIEESTELEGYSYVFTMLTQLTTDELD